MSRKILAALCIALAPIYSARAQVTSPPVAAQNLVNQTIVQNSTHNTTSQAINNAFTATLSTINAMGTWDPITGKYTPNSSPFSNITGTAQVNQGGTGATASASARANLGAAASGANADITALSALTNYTATLLPLWATPLAGVTDVNRISDGVFPVCAEFGSCGVLVGQGHVAAYDIPSNSTLYQWNSIGGYARSAGPTAAVGVFGQLSFSGGGTGTSGDAVNGVATNGPLQTSATGYSVGNLVALEGDMNIKPLLGGGAPSTNAYAIQCAGGSTIQPVGAFPCLHIASAGLGANPLPWKQAIATDDGASPIGIQFGAINTSGNSGSQTANFTGTSGGVRSTGSFGVNGTGAAIVTVPAGQSVNLTDTAGQSTIGQASASAGLTVTGGFLQLPPRTYAQAIAARPCNASNAGTFAFISDSTTTTINASVTGGGTNPATIVCNPTGTGYIVVGG